MADDAFDNAVERGEVDLAEYGNKIYNPRRFAEFMFADENVVTLGDGFSRLRILSRLYPSMSHDEREAELLQTTVLPTLLNDPVLGPYLPDFADGFWLSKVLQYGADVFAA